MAEPSTIARPYAEAAFQIADGAGKLAEWSATLANLSQVVEDPRVANAIGDPGQSAARVAGLVIGVLQGRLTAGAENFVRVLAENRRLALLPFIRGQFEVLKDEREGVVEAEIVSALPLEAKQLEELSAAIARRTGKRVKSKVSVDKDLIGGVKVTIGDKVIDASVRAQLAAMAGALTS